MLQFNKFQKSYGYNVVIKETSLALEKGIYWIKGANGCGKSTLLKSVAGLLSFSGDISLNGLSVKKECVTYKSIVNFSDAEPVFPLFLTGWEMIKLFSHAKKATNNQAEQYIEEMNMHNYLELQIGAYSSGMLKKLSLLLAFLGRPQLILLDEPFITLDADSLPILYKWIKECYEKNSAGFLISSHNSVENDALPNFYEMTIEQQTLRM
jgi:ABC-2 type transport system ATP-binding protein